MNVEIRDARPEDTPAIVELIGELAESIDEPKRLNAGYVRMYLQSPGCHLLLAEVDHQVAGLLSYSVRANLYHAGDGALIDELVVHAPQRGMGIGRALLHEVMQRMEAAGCMEISISTMPDNTGAQRLYRSIGFTDEAVLLEHHFR